MRSGRLIGSSYLTAGVKDGIDVTRNGLVVPELFREVGNNRKCLRCRVLLAPGNGVCDFSTWHGATPLIFGCRVDQLSMRKHWHWRLTGNSDRNNPLWRQS